MSMLAGFCQDLVASDKLLKKSSIISHVIIRKDFASEMMYVKRVLQLVQQNVYFLQGCLTLFMLKL